MKRFWAKVDKSGDCWEWTAFRDGFGYGQISVDGKKVGAHRLVYEMEVGPIPADMCVLHYCDNPPCVNPKHLFIGTRSDNARDRELKGRGRKSDGENNPNATLTERDVACIRRCKGQIKQWRLGEIFGVTQASISNIWRGHTWVHAIRGQYAGG